MPEVKDPMPVQPATKEIPALTDRALLLDLIRTTKDGFARQDARADVQEQRLDGMERQLNIAVDDGKQANQRMTKLEVRFDNFEEQRRTDSLPVKVGRVSENDSKQDAVIATILTDVAHIKEKQAESGAATAAALTSIQGDVKSFAGKHPGLMLALIGLVTALAGGATTCVNDRIQPAKPAPVVVVAAPLMPVADAGTQVTK